MSLKGNVIWENQCSAIKRRKLPRILQLHCGNFGQLRSFEMCCVLTSPWPDMEEEEGQSSLSCVRRTKEEQLHRSRLRGKTAWSQKLGKNFTLHPSSTVVTEESVTIHLLVLISSLKINLPHPFSRSFLTIFPPPAPPPDCFFLLYGINYGFHLIIPITGGDWTQYLRFFAFALSAGLLCSCHYNRCCFAMTGKRNFFALFLKHPEVFSETMQNKANLWRLFYPQLIILVWKCESIISSSINKCSSIEGLAIRYRRALRWRMWIVRQFSSRFNKYHCLNY